MCCDRKWKCNYGLTRFCRYTLGPPMIWLCMFGYAGAHLVVSIIAFSVRTNTIMNTTEIAFSAHTNTTENAFPIECDNLDIPNWFLAIGIIYLLTSLVAWIITISSMFVLCDAYTDYLEVVVMTYIYSMLATIICGIWAISTYFNASTACKDALQSNEHTAAIWKIIIACAVLGTNIICIVAFVICVRIYSYLQAKCVSTTSTITTNTRTFESIHVSEPIHVSESILTPTLGPEIDIVIM